MLSSSIAPIAPNYLAQRRNASAIHLQPLQPFLLSNALTPLRVLRALSRYSIEAGSALHFDVRNICSSDSQSYLNTGWLSYSDHANNLIIITT